MKKFINFMLIAVLICAATIYVAKMSYSNRVKASIDRDYDDEIGKSFDDFRSEMERQRDTLVQNDAANSGLMYKDPTTSGGEYIDPEVATDFFELMPHVVERFNSTVNMETKTAGTLNASVSAIGITLKNILASQEIIMQKSATGQKYCDFTIRDLSLADFGFEVADFINIASYSGSQYNLRRFKENARMTSTEFKKNFGAETGTFLWDFSEGNIDLSTLQFQYNPKTERYRVSFSLRRTDGVAKGAEMYSEFMHNMLTSKHMENFTMAVQTVDMTMVISKDYKIISTDSTEYWAGSLIFDKFRVVGRIGIGINLRMVTTYSYKTSAFQTYTYSA